MGLHLGERRMWRSTWVFSTRLFLVPVCRAVPCPGYSFPGGNLYSRTPTGCRETVFLAGSSPAGSLVSLLRILSRGSPPYLWAEVTCACGLYEKQDWAWGGFLKGVQPCGLFCPEACGSPPSMDKVLRSWALSSQQPLQVLEITDRVCT